ncbi:MAG: hypothetical protein AB1791_07725 [Chloroflexota bacterium]
MLTRPAAGWYITGRKMKQGSLLLLPMDIPQVAPDLGRGAATEQLPRLDIQPELRERLLPFCRLRYGQVWQDLCRTL